MLLLRTVIYVDEKTADCFRKHLNLMENAVLRNLIEQRPRASQILTHPPGASCAVLLLRDLVSDRVHRQSLAAGAAAVVGVHACIV